jgi:histidinol phosphatase-like PHP family hydrolase
MQVLMNRAPWGGGLQLIHDTPAIALRTSVEVQARQWVDDPEDLPLKYAFEYRPQAANSTRGVSLGQTSMAATSRWLPGQEGNWTVLCRVMDVFGASTTVGKSLTVNAVVLDAAVSANLIVRMDAARGSGDITASVGLAASLAGALNSVLARASRAATATSTAGTMNGTTGRTLQQETGAAPEVAAQEQLALRGSIMDVIQRVSGASAAADASQIEQTASAAGSVVEGPCRGDTLSKAAGIFTDLVAGTGQVGLGPGAAQTIAAGATVDMPVLYYIDPKWVDDVDTKGKVEDGTDLPKAVAGADEEGIYAALKVAFPQPEQREDRGEFDVKQPTRLIELADIKAELHAHTTASDGAMTIEQLARMAHARGFHTIAVTDHSQSSTIAGGLKPDRLRKHIDDVHSVHAKLHKELGITVLAGSEVDILADGSLDYKDDLLAQLDVVVASPHAALTQDTEAATKRLLKAIEHPLVHILGHPTGRLVMRRGGLSPDMARLFAAAKQHNVAMEINAHWMRLDLRDTHVRQAVNAGCVIAIDCDVHAPSDYDNLRFGVMTARRGWLTADMCINTWDAKKLHAWLKSKR